MDADAAQRAVFATSVSPNPTTTTIVTRPTDGSGGPGELPTLDLPLAITIFLVSDAGKLVEQVRAVPQARASLRTRLDELFRGARSEDFRLRSAIDPGTKLIRVFVKGGTVATVDLSGDVLPSTIQDQILAVAQIVYTLTQPPTSITAVRFAREGQPFPVPKGDGATTTDPIERADFPDVIQPPS